ncbi:MAG: VOC family protein [Gemmatimonadota bacterium]
MSDGTRRGADVVRANHLPRPSAPTLKAIVETSVYVSDLHAARHFYAHTLGLEVLLTSTRLLALRAGGLSVLLLLQRTAASGRHAGAQALSFIIAGDSVDAWIEWLQASGVTIDARITSPRGDDGVYVRDPDGHLIELVAPGLWSQE